MAGWHRCSRAEPQELVQAVTLTSVLWTLRPLGQSAHMPSAAIAKGLLGHLDVPCTAGSSLEWQGTQSPDLMSCSVTFHRLWRRVSEPGLNWWPSRPPDSTHLQCWKYRHACDHIRYLCGFWGFELRFLCSCSKYCYHQVISPVQEFLCAYLTVSNCHNFLGGSMKVACISFSRS